MSSNTNRTQERKGKREKEREREKERDRQTETEKETVTMRGIERDIFSLGMNSLRRLCYFPFSGSLQNFL